MGRSSKFEGQGYPKTMIFNGHRYYVRTAFPTKRDAEEDAKRRRAGPFGAYVRVVRNVKEGTWVTYVRPRSGRKK